MNNRLQDNRKMNLTELRKEIETLQFAIKDKRFSDRASDIMLFKEMKSMLRGIKQTVEAVDCWVELGVCQCECRHCMKDNKEWQKIKELLK